MGLSAPLPLVWLVLKKYAGFITIKRIGVAFARLLESTNLSAWFINLEWFIGSTI